MNDIEQPDLDTRFLEPKGWQWHHFDSHDFNMRFGYAIPEKAEALVVCLPGLGEFGEKYFEIAQTCLAQDLGVFVIDWPGQGGSSDFMDNRAKRHSLGYDLEINILHDFISSHIQPLNTDKLPLAMLAHSMGGHIGLHYLAQHPKQFSCAAFSAPMWGLRAVDDMPRSIARFITTLGALFMGQSYAHGQGPWSFDLRDLEKNKIYSHDAKRERLHNYWCDKNPALQMGGVTWRWLYESVRSCAILQNPSYLDKIKTHCLIALADNERIVSNNTIEAVSNILPRGNLVRYEHAFHELLMEVDNIRNDFMLRFFDMIDHTKA